MGGHDMIPPFKSGGGGGRACPLISHLLIPMIQSATSPSASFMTEPTCYLKVHRLMPFHRKNSFKVYISLALPLFYVVNSLVIFHYQLLAILFQVPPAFNCLSFHIFLFTNNRSCLIKWLIYINRLLQKASTAQREQKQIEFPHSEFSLESFVI